MEGTVVWFSNPRGYGFIKPDNGQADIFVYYSDIKMRGYKFLQKDDRVSFELGTIEKDGQSKPKAVKVEVIHASRAVPNNVQAPEQQPTSN